MLSRHYTKGASHIQWPRSFGSFLLLHLSNTFLKVLAAPNKALFCRNPVLMVIPSLSSHVSNLLFTAPSVPTTTCITSCCLIPIVPIALFKSWYLSFFSPSFSYTHNNNNYYCLVSLLFNNNVRFSGFNNTVTLYSHIPQNLTSFIFHHIIRLLIRPFRTSAHYYVQFIKASVCKPITKSRSGLLLSLLHQ